MTPKDIQQKLEVLLKKIRDFIGDGNYIYRGEPSRTHKIGNKIDENPPVSSNLYRQYKKAIKQPQFQIKIMQELMLVDVKKHTKEKDDDTILEQLQHYGGKTNQIDFSADYLIALFFACDGQYQDDGRLIFLDRTKLEKKGEIYEPVHPQNRVIAQKSVFVRPPSGIVEPDEIFPIKKNLKEFILIYLDKHHNINTESMYNDIHGFIYRKRNYENAYIHFYLGFSYQNEGELKLAIKHYTKALKHDPNNPSIYNNRGNTHHKKGDYNKAILDHTNAIKLDPDDMESHYNRGNVYTSKGEDDSAIADYTKAIELNPDYAPTYYNRGNAYFKKNEYDSAIADYTKAIELSPDHLVYSNRGFVYHQKGAYDKAIADYTKAIELNPDYAPTHYNRGVTNLRKEKYDSAAADLHVALQLSQQKGSEKLAEEIQRLLNLLLTRK